MTADHTAYDIRTYSCRLLAGMDVVCKSIYLHSVSNRSLFSFTASFLNLSWLNDTSSSNSVWRSKVTARNTKLKLSITYVDGEHHNAQRYRRTTDDANSWPYCLQYDRLKISSETQRVRWKYGRMNPAWKLKLKAPTFTYRHLQGNPNSSGLQFEVAYSSSSRRRSAISGRPLPK